MLNKEEKFTISSVTLGIPTIARVVSHLVGHVLSEAQFFLADTTSSEEQVDASNKVAQRLVVYQFLKIKKLKKTKQIK